MQSDILALIGNTPLVELKNYQEKNELQSKIFAKLEGQNPFGSAKDRAAFFMIEAAEKCGHLNPDSTIIEPTSGNTGIALAAIAAIKGYKTIIVMPSNASAERIAILKLYGAKVVLTPGKDGMNGAIKKALELKKEIKNSYIPDQFTNEFNVKAHEETTACEILDSKISFDCFVCGVGTGGTLTGVSKVLKKHQPNIKIVAVEPRYSVVLSEKVKCTQNKTIKDILSPIENLEKSNQSESSSASKATDIKSSNSVAFSEKAKCAQNENYKSNTPVHSHEQKECTQQQDNSYASKATDIKPSNSVVFPEKAECAQDENYKNTLPPLYYAKTEWHQQQNNSPVSKAVNIKSSKSVIFSEKAKCMLERKHPINLCSKTTHERDQQKTPTTSTVFTNNTKSFAKISENSKPQTLARQAYDAAITDLPRVTIFFTDFASTCLAEAKSVIFFEKNTAARPNNLKFAEIQKQRFSITPCTTDNTIFTNTKEEKPIVRNAPLYTETEFFPEKSPQCGCSAFSTNKDVASQGIPGLGAGFVPKICDTGLIDYVEKVSYQEAICEVKNLAKTEGLLVGISSGAALCAAKKLAKKLAKKSEFKNILVIFPDGGEKYLSDYTKI